MFKNGKNLVPINSLEKIQKQSSKGVLKKFAEFAGKHLNWSLFKYSCRLRCFHVNFAKFLKTPVLQSICDRLLLKIMFIHIRSDETIYAHITD